MAMLTRIGNGLFYYLPVALLIAAWGLSSKTGLLSQDIAPSPGATAEALVSMLMSGDLVVHARISLFRELTGLAISILVGVMVGIGMARIEWFRILIRPSVTFLYPMPKSALIPILLLWFGLGHMSKIAAVFLGCLLPMVISSYNGARGVEPQLIWSARSLGASPFRVLIKVIFMAALPDIMSGMRIALALSWLLLVSAEMMISQNGLGYLISYYGETGDYANMFASVGVVIALGYLSDRLFLLAMGRILRWREAAP